VADPSTTETFRAAVEALFPSGERPGGVELRAHQHVIELVELGLPPGFPELIAALLDGYAAVVRPDTRFADLDPPERVTVLRTMSADPNPDTKDAADIFWIFSLGAMYSEWTGYDPGTRELGVPAMWEDVGYPGPAIGHPVYREDV